MEGLWQIAPSCQSVYPLQPVEKPVHVAPVPLEEPADLLRRDLKFPQGNLIPDRLRLDSDVDGQLPDIHHSIFHACPRSIKSFYLSYVEKHPHWDKLSFIQFIINMLQR